MGLLSFLSRLRGSSGKEEVSQPVVETQEEPNIPSGETNMITKEKLEIIANAVQTVETISSMAATAPTGAQKAQAAIAIATAVDPQLQDRVPVIQSIIGSLVSIFNTFGIFKKKAAQPVPSVAPSFGSVGGTAQSSGVQQ